VKAEDEGNVGLVVSNGPDGDYWYKPTLSLEKHLRRYVSRHNEKINATNPNNPNNIRGDQAPAESTGGIYWRNLLSEANAIYNKHPENSWMKNLPGDAYLSRDEVDEIDDDDSIYVIKPQLWSEVIELKAKDVKAEDEGDVGLVVSNGYDGDYWYKPTLSLEKHLRRYVSRHNEKINATNPNNIRGDQAPARRKELAESTGGIYWRNLLAEANAIDGQEAQEAQEAHRNVNA
jgi:hypothetical protein